MPLKICIASSDVLGPIRDGDVATACTALAQELAHAGHTVTLLYALDFYEDGSVEIWRDFYRQFGIAFLPLPSPTTPPLISNPNVYEWDAVEKSYLVYEYLKASDFDIIHFSLHAGLGYFTAVAKRQGVALANTSIWVTCHAPTLWSRRNDFAACDDIAFHVRDRLERGLVENCDCLVSSSEYMLGWMREHAWPLPARTVVIANLLPCSGAGAVTCDSDLLPATWRGVPRELVFFGQLQVRKGLRIFCDAIDRLVGWWPDDLEIAFLGKSSTQFDAGWIGSRVKEWPFGWRIIDDLNRFEATQYLRGAGRLAVMPSVADNSPYEVQESLCSGIPFLATDVGGIAELIMAEDRAGVLCEPNPIALAEALRKVFQAGAVSASPAHSRDSVGRAHRGLYAAQEQENRSILHTARCKPSRAMPLVSVCILHFDRGAELSGAIESVFAQTYKDLEIIVVDNGSRLTTALDHLDILERRYGSDGLRIIRLPENVYEPMARNTAAAAAGGEFLMFMDDDNRAKPHEVELFVTAALHTDADIYTCFSDHFETDHAPDEDASAVRRHIVIGDAGPVGLIFNAYGDVNFFTRRDRFQEIGGFVEDKCFNHAEDWRFLARAYVKGLKISVVPEALFWYKAQGAPGRPSSRKHDISGAQHRAAASTASGPASDDTFLLLAQGLFWKAMGTQRELESLRQRLDARENELVIARSALAQQRRLIAHARETVQVLHDGFRQIVEVSGPDPRIERLWQAAQYRCLPYSRETDTRDARVEAERRGGSGKGSKSGGKHHM